jgi:hypothetical protein
VYGLIACLLTLIAVALLEHRFRHALVRLALCLASLIVLGLSQPPPVATIYRQPPARPMQPPALCAANKNRAVEDVWFCAGIRAAADWHTQKIQAHFLVRATALFSLVWLAASPGFRAIGRRIHRAGLFKEGTYSPPDAA